MTESFVRTEDGVDIFYKDWGTGQPIVFHHGWPLSADDWDAQMLYFVNKGYRVIAHDRRGHGRSTQVSEGHDIAHYAKDVAALTTKLGLSDAIHIGHSTGGGEAVAYVARHGGGRPRARARAASPAPRTAPGRGSWPPRRGRRRCAGTRRRTSPSARTGGRTSQPRRSGALWEKIGRWQRRLEVPAFRRRKFH